MTTSLKPKPSDGDFVASRGLVADAFFGASPVVASALDIRAARPARIVPDYERRKKACAFGHIFK